MKPPNTPVSVKTMNSLELGVREGDLMSGGNS